MSMKNERDMLHGSWHTLKGKAKETWGKLTDDDLTEIDGRREKLAGKLETRYGWNRTRVDDEIDRFVGKPRD